MSIVSLLPVGTVTSSAVGEFMGGKASVARTEIRGNTAGFDPCRKRFSLTRQGVAT